MSFTDNLTPDRESLRHRLRHQAAPFSSLSKAQKLIRRPFRFLVSEASVRLQTVIETQAQTFWGGSMHLTLPEPVSTFIYRYGYFEEGLTALFIEVLRKGDCFMDVGSHYGYFSLLAHKLVGETGRIVAFEPTPSTFRVNRRNTGEFPNVRVENKAAWSEPKTIRLTDLGVAWSSHNSLVKPKMVPEGAKTTTRVYDVSCVKLDEYIREHGLKPRLIKIDAESAELEILKGLRSTLESIRPIVTLEVGDDPNAGIEARSVDTISYCAALGYVPFIYMDGQIRRHQIKDVYEYDNVFMIPEEKMEEALPSR